MSDCASKLTLFRVGAFFKCVKIEPFKHSIIPSSSSRIIPNNTEEEHIKKRQQRTKNVLHKLEKNTINIIY